MEQRETFDKAAKIYDETRPSYPDEVIEWILEKTKVSKERKLLEIGSGTGQATLKFAEKGYKIHCIELGQNLAEILMQKGEKYGIEVDVNSFEKWAPKYFKTPLIFSATAFHWIEPTIRYRKCYELLEENGHLVLIWNVAPDSEYHQVQKAYDLLWGYYPEKKKKNRPQIESIKEARKLDIEKSGYFNLTNYLDYKWKYSTPREQFTKEFFSQSSFLALHKNDQGVLSKKIIDLYSTLEDMVETEIHTTVYIAKKGVRL